MRLFGWNITRDVVPAKQKALSQPGGSRGGWFPIIRESFAGAWQQNVEVDNDTVLTYFAVFACMTLIAGDIAKLGLRMMEKTRDGIWIEADEDDVSAVLRKPNPMQTRIQFWETYFLSKLSNGNTYVLKVRDARQRVIRLYVLDPNRVQPLVAPTGEVFYRLAADDIAGLEDEIIVPASEIIHDRFNCLYHPLIGLSPIVAAGLTAMQGHSIQQDAATFFKNRGIPGGVLTAPGAIGEDTAKRLKEYWETNFTGKNAGKVAVAGDGLKFEAMRVSAADAQMIEQLRWTAEVVCSVFHVPPYKIGIGQMPTYNNVQALNTEYYSQALQVLIESAELLLDEGLELAAALGTEFDLRDLLRMDSTAQVNKIKEAVAAGVMAPNEGRLDLNLPPVKGGQTPYLQQQNYSLAALDERDRQNPLAQKDQTERAVARMRRGFEEA